MPPAIDIPPLESSFCTIPRMPDVPYRFAIHLYAGQRRPGDLQNELESEQAHAEASAVMLSIDIVNGERGDLSKWENILFWMDLISQGYVVLVVGDPPCETWSAAKDPKGSVVTAAVGA